jgi:phosphopantothenoylcysteine decarboxylase/phosphopantothenate--cysteine ligase
MGRGDRLSLIILRVEFAMTGLNILLGVTGGIAAYKTPELVRRLRDRGATVQVVLTASAAQFVTETTLQAVSGRPVRANLWDRQAEAAMGHIELARWADKVLIAPATAEFMARLASGSASDLLATLCLATEAPLSIAPSMNHVMWANAAVQANLELLLKRGIRLLGPADGDQACGETGPGRMLEPDDIAAAICAEESDRRPIADATGILHGKRVMITAGPTRESIDPVRFISNRSSGKMGYALASAASDAGATVVLLSGPVGLPAPEGVELISVETAEEMSAATHASIDDVDIFIAAAAVSDYRPHKVETNKIKKKEPTMTVDLVKSPDILASVANLDRAPFTVGFAAETDQVREHALGKLKAKRLDMIIANEVGAGLGFEKDDNAVHVFWRSGDREYPLTHKTELAKELIDLINERYEADSAKNTVVDITKRTATD